MVFVRQGNQVSYAEISLQRQRGEAAIELSLVKPKAVLFETRAPGFRQQKLLGL